MELDPKSTREFAWDKPMANKEVKIMLSKDKFYDQVSIIKIDKMN